MTTEDSPIPYMARTRDWYLALGYGNPYRWAHYESVPFQRLEKPLGESTVALVTTAAPYRPGNGPQGPGAPYNAAAKFYAVYSGDSAHNHDLRISHVAIDRKHTSMEDSGTWFPLPALRRLALQGRVGKIAARFHGVPTNRSQTHTIDIDCPQVLSRCREDAVDAAVLVANCPVCHQSLALVARHLEAHGIATVLMGCARDIVEHAGVPRFLFSDFPLGNAAGRPNDPQSQEFTLALALGLLENATGPRSTVQSPLRWSADAGWKRDYSNVEQVDAAELPRLREEAEKARQAARSIRAGTIGPGAVSEPAGRAPG
jgi:D-proline reductase (dithiol) PrdB